MQEEMITITKKQFDDMYEDATMMNCLRNAGVDNWDYWDIAVEEYHGIMEEENG